MSFGLSNSYTEMHKTRYQFNFMFGKHYVKNYLLENKTFFIFSFYDDKVARQEFDIYSCCKERSVTKSQNDNNSQLFQYPVFRRQKKFVKEYAVFVLLNFEVSSCKIKMIVTKKKSSQS